MDLTSPSPQEESQPSQPLPAVVSQSYELDLAQRPSWSVEANFMLLPIFQFDRQRAAKENGSLVQSVPVVKNGSVMSSRLSITTGDRQEEGKLVRDNRPGSFDMSVLFCLMDLWDEQGRKSDGVVNFRLNTVCTRLKMNDSGRSYEQIKSSILRLSRTKIESMNAYYSLEKADYISLSMSILDDAVIHTHAGGSRSAGGCSVKIGRHILTNLLNNYTAKINRQIYQQLDVGFAQRILCLVLFKQQLENELGVIDFELMELAELIPMSGKLYPSTIINRLGTALAELEEKRIFRHEFLRLGKSHVLRLIPFEKVQPQLVGLQSLPRFHSLIDQVYGRSLFELIELAPEALERLVERDPIITEMGGRRYTWTIHVVSVFAHMVAHNYSVRDKARTLKTLLGLDEKKLELPLDFRPIDLLVEDKLKKASLERAVSARNEQEQAADAQFHLLARSYVDRLTRQAREKYEERIRARNPDRTEPMPWRIRQEIAEEIEADMKAGAEIDLEKSEPRGMIQ